MRWFHRDRSNGECRRFRATPLHIVFGVLLAGTLVLLFGYFVMLLWNGLMPDIVNARPITYWQGMGLLLLARILVGGIGHGKCGHDRHSRRDGEKPWQEYDRWWRETGEKNFGPGSTEGPDAQNSKDHP